MSIEKTLGRLLFEAEDQSGAGWAEKWRDHSDWEYRADEAAAMRMLWDDQPPEEKAHYLGVVRKAR